MIPPAIDCAKPQIVGAAPDILRRVSGAVFLTGGQENTNALTAVLIQEGSTYAQASEPADASDNCPVDNPGHKA